MFGYITADARLLTEEQQTRYAACYCGLCRRLGRECSAVSRLTLTYDMTFLVLLLSSLYEPEETAGRNRCAVHPVKARPHWHNDATNYGVAMNTALAAYNCLDDWQDDRNLPKLALWKLLRRPVRAIQERYPQQIREGVGGPVGVRNPGGLNGRKLVQRRGDGPALPRIALLYGPDRSAHQRP